MVLSRKTCTLCLRMETFSVHARDQVHSLSDCEYAIVIMRDKVRLKSIECLKIAKVAIIAF